jgi:hypothetical protein
MVRPRGQALNLPCACDSEQLAGGNSMQNSGPRHRVLCTLWALYGLLCVLTAAWAVVYSTTLTLMWGAIINRVADPFFWMNMFHIWLAAFVVILLLAAIFSFVLAVALMRGRAVGNPVAVVASVFAMVTNPLGIALGGYTLVVTVPRPAAEARANYASAA